MNRVERDRLLSDAKYAVGDYVELTRGKYKGSVVRISYVDIYEEGKWTGQRYARARFIGYLCPVETGGRVYRGGSLRSVVALTEQEIDEVTTALIQTYKELVGE